MACANSNRKALLKSIASETFCNYGRVTDRRFP
jgi:hypothetical protein